jgi:hypothetical protein
MYKFSHVVRWRGRNGFLVDEEKTEKEGEEKEILSVAILQQFGSFVVAGEIDQDSKKFKSFYRIIQKNC